MSPVTLFLVFTLIWWMVFFMILPLGVQAQNEDDEGIVEGTVPSAPRNPLLKKKIIWTSLISGVLTGIYYTIVLFDLITLDPFAGK